MAWNRSKRNSSSAKGHCQTKDNSRLRLSRHLSVAAIAAMAIVAAWVLCSREPERQPADGQVRHRKIPSVGTGARSNAVASASLPAMNAVGQLSPVWQKFYDGRDTNKWIVIVDPITGKEQLNRRVRPRWKSLPQPLYKSHALNVLDAIAFKPVTSPMLGIRVNAKFLESFQEGLFEKIEILPGDSEDVKSRKEGMIELRKELMQRIKGGESIEKIVSDSIKERNYIAEYRHQMQMEYGRLKREGESQDLVETFGERCNEILSGKGARPIMTRKLMEEIANEREQGAL